MLFLADAVSSPVSRHLHMPNNVEPINSVERYQMQLTAMIASQAPTVMESDVNMYEHVVMMGKECSGFAAPDLKKYTQYAQFCLDSVWA